MARDKEVSINRTAATAVNLARNGVAPELPKKVWLDPPNAAPIPAPRPDWSKTMKIRARLTIICTIVIAVIISKLYKPLDTKKQAQPLKF
jgi:hypothetical protein